MATTKTQAPKQSRFEIAIAKLDATIHAVHDNIVQSRAKHAEQFKTAINYAIDAGKASKLEAGEIRDSIVKLFDDSVAANLIEKSTARAYMTGLRFALDRGILWNPALHSAEGQIQALKDAGKKIPDALAKKAAEMDEKAAAKRDAKNGKTHVASKETIIKSLAKALADARTIGDNEWAADILDCIHAKMPEWKEPTADAK